jgi:hypothetical protein
MCISHPISSLVILGSTHAMFASLDLMMLAGLAFDTNGRFIGL